MRLETNEAELVVSRHGGCVLAYRYLRNGNPLDLLRPWAGPSEDTPDPLESANFPLIPYSNRIEAGRFRFDGTRYQTPLNFGDHPHSIHGIGWTSLWEVTETSPSSATLEISHDGSVWPFPFHAVQRFRLNGARLHHALTLTNTGTLPMPAGLGIHPYFPRHSGARLQAEVSHVWQTDPTCLPTQRIPCPAEWTLSSGADPDHLNCDNQFEPWDGKAVIDWPKDGSSLTMEASTDLDRLVVYAPAGENFFCVEPVSHMTDAFNRTANGSPIAETGMRVLGPGETWQVEIRFSPGDL